MKKANQWTSLSEQMMQKASKAMKTAQIRRLIHSEKNDFKSGDENDQVVVKLLFKDQERVLGPIIAHMSDVQQIELLMLWLTPEQRP